MKYKTCISIGETNPNKIKKILQHSLKKSEFAEVRFDFLKPEHIPVVLEAIKKDLKSVVCTLRPKKEGGKFEGNERERISILKLIAEYNPFLIDVEFSTIKQNKDLTKYLKKTKTRLLISEHDFKKTPKLSELQKKVSQMSKFSKNIKIVTTAKSIEDSATILELYSKKKDQNLIAFAMGDQGRISRILGLYLGSPYAYVSLGKPIAPGQFSVDELKRIIDIQNSKSSK